MSEVNQYIFQRGFSAIIIVKNGDVESMVKFPDDMDSEEWQVVKEAVDYKLQAEEKIDQIRKDRQIRLGLELMEKLHN